VIPSKDCQLIQSSNQIPPSGDVSGYEDPKGEDREGVHESAAIAGALLSGDSCSSEELDGRNRDEGTPYAARLRKVRGCKE
jgi:hypothetical protein